MVEYQLYPLNPLNSRYCMVSGLKQASSPEYGFLTLLASYTPIHTSVFVLFGHTLKSKTWPSTFISFGHTLVSKTLSHRSWCHQSTMCFTNFDTLMYISLQSKIAHQRLKPWQEPPINTGEPPVALSHSEKQWKIKQRRDCRSQVITFVTNVGQVREQSVGFLI